MSEFGISPETEEQIKALQRRFRAKGIKVQGAIQKALLKSALIVERYAKENMTENGPSSPGEFPAVDTGRLRASITHRVEFDAGESAAFVGTNIEYAKALEFGEASRHLAPRPFMRPSLEANRKEIVEIIAQATNEATASKEEEAE